MTKSLDLNPTVFPSTLDLTPEFMCAWEDPPYNDHNLYERLCELSTASEFYFNVKDSDGVALIAVTPKRFFHKEGCMWDRHMMIEHLLPEDFGEEMESVWGCERSVEEVRKDMIARGFEENESFTKLINEDFE